MVRAHDQNTDKILIKCIAVSGYSAEDIAGKLDMSPGYIKKCIYTAFSDKRRRQMMQIFMDKGIYDGIFFYVPEKAGVTTILLRLKKALDLSQKEMARHLDMKVTRYRDIELHGDPTLSEYDKIKNLARQHNIIITH